MIIWSWQVSYTKSQRVSIDDETLISNEFRKHIPQQIIEEQYIIDKNILKWLLKDQEIPWCHIENRLTLKIK
jgi:hypothetical protein